MLLIVAIFDEIAQYEIQIPQKRWIFRVYLLAQGGSALSYESRTAINDAAIELH
jgi:hypothetical protein